MPCKRPSGGLRRNSPPRWWKVENEQKRNFLHNNGGDYFMEAMILSFPQSERGKVGLHGHTYWYEVIHDVYHLQYLRPRHGRGRPEKGQCILEKGLNFEASWLKLNYSSGLKTKLLGKAKKHGHFLSKWPRSLACHYEITISEKRCGTTAYGCPVSSFS